MNDSMSILLATTILALGGLGLYMYKSSDEQDNDNSRYDEEGIFGNSKLFEWNRGDDEEDEDENEEFEEEYKPRKRNAKTQRNRKTNGTSKRRY